MKGLENLLVGRFNSKPIPSTKIITMLRKWLRIGGAGSCGDGYVPHHLSVTPPRQGASPGPPERQRNSVGPSSIVRALSPPARPLLPRRPLALGGFHPGRWGLALLASLRTVAKDQTNATPSDDSIRRSGGKSGADAYGIGRPAIMKQGRMSGRW